MAATPSNHYHCNISEIKPGNSKYFTGPYKSVHEVVTMTGMPYKAWLEHHQKLNPTHAKHKTLLDG